MKDQPKHKEKKSEGEPNTLAALVHEPEVKEMISKAELGTVHLVIPEHHPVAL